MTLFHVIDGSEFLAVIQREGGEFREHMPDLNGEEE